MVARSRRGSDWRLWRSATGQSGLWRSASFDRCTRSCCGSASNIHRAKRTSHRRNRAARLVCRARCSRRSCCGRQAHTDRAPSRSFPTCSGRKISASCGFCCGWDARPSTARSQLRAPQPRLGVDDPTAFCLALSGEQMKIERHKSFRRRQSTQVFAGMRLRAQR